LSDYENFKNTGCFFISKTTYARFKLPYILRHLDKCIYLDSDIVVRKDISEMWSIDIKNYYLGAVEEPSGKIRNMELQIPQLSSYFNNGILLLNLKKLREFGFKKKAYDYMQDHPHLLYGDQDVFNALFHDNWLPLPMKWNLTTSMYLTKKLLHYTCYPDNEISAALKNPAIVHYTQEKKPDSVLCQHPFRGDYIIYRSLTSWKDDGLKDQNVKSYFIRFYWMIKSFLREFPLAYLFVKQLKLRLLNCKYFNESKY